MQISAERALPRFTRPTIESIAAAGVTVGTALAAGWIVVGSGQEAFVLGLAGLTILALVAAANAGVAAGLLVLAVLNGIPLVDFEQFAVSGRFRVSDVLVVGLGGLLAISALRPGGKTMSHRAVRWSIWWSAAFVAWWTWTLVTSVLDDGVPLVQAALFGRDFLYFALLLPLVAIAFRGRAEVLGLLVTLGAGALAYAFGQLGLVFAGFTGAFESLVHESAVLEYEGVPRVYAFMSEATLALIPLSLGLALMGRARNLRIAGALLFAMSGLSILLQFSRAVYVGLGLALVAVSAIWMVRSPAAGSLRRAWVLVSAGVVAAVFLAATGFRPSLSSPTAEAISTRAASTFEELQAGSGNVRYRYKVSEAMLDRLQGHWPTGLGFWHPEAKPVSTLPDYSIRNGDVGVLNAVMTMGIIGTILLYLPLAAVLIATLRRRGAGTGEYEWLYYGVGVWIVAVLVGSLTLVTLFSTPGLVLAAVILGCAVHLLGREEPGPQAASAAA
jgi:hypothetical protein